ncbi:Protein of unknown function (DUF3160) [Desulfosporosinus orientis DSM 765]|uniref:DUF3160 domain-containing protein n=1 Tax=Desulfosporosinus orientis (strain ATCC 19365 / DSM 765 / NCIMB 8382 / VKM B-1628 / Singapore I) TaxID=768706 RepID=G7WHR7_DESOD|nr:DUF3160 domain-containing protein [Desulfosporosinus orientis]AET69629.1 Protein of unknown function (DUF3160) [Desulfosporosinus orientis DSM 765]
MKIRKSRSILYISMVIILLTSLMGCQGPSPDGQPPQADVPLVSLPQSTAAFAAYKEIPLSVKPSVNPYQIAADLGNITNKDRYKLSSQAENILSKNGFVVVPSPYQEFFSSYENNRYDSIPNFITADAMLHNYHLYFDHLLRTLEKDKLRGELNTLTGLMLTESQKQYEVLKGTAWENAAARNVAYFAVAARLLDPKVAVPAYVSKEVEQELQLIADHTETGKPSPVMNMGNSSADLAQALKEDYTQYNPRGHYTKSDELKSYFRTMMWYGRMTFRAKSQDETKSAVLVTLLLGRQQIYDHWNSIYEPTNFLVGKSDDLGFSQYYGLLLKTFTMGEITDLNELTGNVNEWTSFCDGLAKLEPPAINSIPIFDQTIQPDREKEIKGFRFMGQRFTVDAAVFQKLIYREVEENNEGQRRMLPKGLDIPAAMGSQEAYAILEGMGETGYEKYPENMKKIQVYLAGLDTNVWTQNLYWSWLYTLAPLTEAKGDGYPVFMNNQAWTRKQLETFLGSWTELKHDTILYAKQVYAEMGGGDLPLDDRGYVEPNPVVYGRLAALTRMTIEGLNNRGLLNEKDQTSLERLEELALKLKSIADKELSNQNLDDQDYELIRGFGGQLEHFWLEALSDEGVDHRSAIDENPAALIADVATDPNGEVLEEGTGFVSDIYVVVPVEGQLRISKGAVYSYYEFPWPARDRLTDQKWKEMLENGRKIDQPSWVQTYSVPAW